MHPSLMHAQKYSTVRSEQAQIETAIPGTPDVIIGFSQGANLATVLAARAAARAAPLPSLVLLCPSRPGWTSQLGGLFSTKIPTRALVSVPSAARAHFAPEAELRFDACGCHAPERNMPFKRAAVM